MNLRDIYLHIQAYLPMSMHTLLHAYTDSLSPTHTYMHPVIHICKSGGALLLLRLQFLDPVSYQHLFFCPFCPSIHFATFFLLIIVYAEFLFLKGLVGHVFFLMTM